MWITNYMKCCPYWEQFTEYSVLNRLRCLAISQCYYTDTWMLKCVSECMKDNWHLKALGLNRPHVNRGLNQTARHFWVSKINFTFSWGFPTLSEFLPCILNNYRKLEGFGFIETASQEKTSLMIYQPMSDTVSLEKTCIKRNTLRATQCQ